MNPNNKSMKHSSSLAEFSCDDNAFTEHLKQRINDIISRTKDNSQYTQKSNDGDILFNNDNAHSINNNKNKLSKEERKKILKDFIGDILTKRKEEIKIQKELYNNIDNSNEDIDIDDKNYPHNQSKYIQDKNPHANFYDDIKMFNKSSSCQRPTHMRKIYNIPLHEAKSARTNNV